MDLSSSGLQLVMCPGSMRDSRYFSYYEKIYNCWWTVWGEALREIGINKKLFSDTFTRQDYVVGLFRSGNCLGSISLRWVNSRLDSFGNDSFFSYWPQDTIKSIKNLGDQIVLISGMAADPSIRNQKLGFRMRDLLAGLAIKSFIESGADGAASAVRVDRKVNESFLRWGGLVMRSGVAFEYDQSNTDLMCFSRESVFDSSTHDLQSMVSDLWENHLEIPTGRIDLSPRVWAA